MQMKRTLGMLLALCFLMSVTVAAVGAVGQPSTGNWGNYTDHHPVAPPSYHHPVAPPSYHHPVAPPSYHHPVAPPSYYHPAPLVPVFKPGHGPIVKPVFKPIAKKVTYKLVKIPAHFETKKVNKFVGFKHGKKVYKTVTIKIFVHAKWIKIPVYNNHNNHNNNNHR